MASEASDSSKNRETLVVAYRIATQRASRPSAEVSNVRLYGEGEGEPGPCIGLIKFHSGNSPLPSDTVDTDKHGTEHVVLNARERDYGRMMDMVTGSGELLIGISNYPGPDARAYLKHVTFVSRAPATDPV